MNVSHLRGLLTRWRPKPQPEPVSLAFTDATVDRLRGLQQEHAADTRWLAEHQPIWERLTGRTDPEADIEKRALAPELVERKARVQRLTADIAAAQQTIHMNQTAAEAYPNRRVRGRACACARAR